MKKMIFTILICLTINGYAQKDSTVIKFNYIENEDLELMNELNGIQMISLTCSDTLMKGKRFSLSIEEYKLGELSKIDSLGLTCVEQRVPVIVGADTMIYVMNMCDRIAYNDLSREFRIRIAGKFQNDSLNLMIRYPGIGLGVQLKGAENYLLKKIQPSANEKTKIKLNTKIPVLAYTGPFETGSGINSYCLLNNESAELWYDKFKVKHYYIFYLEIK